MEDLKQVVLEPAIAIDGFSVTPIAVTIVLGLSHPGAPVVIVREALGAIVRDVRGIRVLMVDGRELTLAELASEHPGLVTHES
ncbi:MAG: hypothetical protein ACOC7M_01325 [Chloroflexota bacterium]